MRNWSLALSQISKELSDIRKRCHWPHIYNRYKLFLVCLFQIILSAWLSYLWMTVVTHSSNHFWFFLLPALYFCSFAKLTHSHYALKVIKARRKFGDYIRNIALHRWGKQRPWEVRGGLDKRRGRTKTWIHWGAGQCSFHITPLIDAFFNISAAPPWFRPSLYLLLYCSNLLPLYSITVYLHIPSWLISWQYSLCHYIGIWHLFRSSQCRPRVLFSILGHFVITFIISVIFIFTYIPKWCSGKQSASQCKRCKSPGFDLWVRNISWGRNCQLTPVFLFEKFHGQRNLVGYNPWGCKESNTTEQLSTHTTFNY